MIANLRQLLRRGGGGRVVLGGTSRSHASRRRVALDAMALETRQLMAGGLTLLGPYNASHNATNQSEATVAVNPTNPQNVVVLGNDNDTLGDLFLGVSFDGGKTFTSTTTANGAGGLTKACCDASAAFDQFGNLFVTYLDDAITSAPVIMSTDGGKTFTQPFVVSNVSDQPKLAVGPGAAPGSGSLWIEYQDSGGKIGGVGVAVNGLGQLGTPTASQLIPGSDGGNFGKPAIGPKGQVMFAYELPSGGTGPASLYYSLDPDGLGPQGFNSPVKYADVNVGGFAPVPLQAIRTTDSEVGFAYDSSGGPKNGRLYIVYTDSPAVNSPNTDIYVAYSDNDGQTWSQRVKVNDDQGGATQMMPRIAVDQFTGNVAVSFYDGRDDTGSGQFDTDGKANTDAEYYVTVSVDNGQSFLPNLRVSNGPSNATYAGGGSANQGNEYGDYTGLAFTNNVIYPAWADNSKTLAGNPSPGKDLEIATAQVTLQSLTATIVNFAATEATDFQGTVATFKPAVTGLPTSAFTAQINWGDGQVTGGGIVLSGSKYSVQGQHTYQQGGNYQVVVNITQTGATTATASGTVSVAGLPITASGTSLSLKEGDGYAGILAHFVDASPIPQTASHYSAQVAFGDGTSAAGTIVANPNGGFDVLDQTGHVYGGGNYAIIITISKPGFTATASTDAHVIDSALHATDLIVTPTEGTAYTLPVATFTDDDPRVPPPSNYFATIDWGDGTPTTTGVIVPNPNGAGFAVVDQSGTNAHTYSFGSYGIVVTIGNYSGSSTAVAVSSADVGDAPISATGFKFKPAAGTQFTGIVAAFSDADPRANKAGHYQAVIDWGDGTPKDTGTVLINEDGGYLVQGTHAYKPGSFAISTVVSDAGGSSADAPGSAVVPDAPVDLRYQGAYAYEGVPSRATFAVFETSDLLAQASDYAATINFGDGTSAPATIMPIAPSTPNSGLKAFAIGFQNKVYDAAGTYAAKVSLTSPGGSQRQTSGPLYVTASPITATSASLTGESKTSLGGVTVATFTTGNPKATASTYSASVDWGDGTTTPGTIAPNGLGGFVVQGTHAYAGGGSYPLNVTITGSGVAATASGTASIADRLFPITGTATTSSGAISASGATNSSRPTFTGTAEPFASVSILAGSTVIGTGQADASGHYRITSSTLSDGRYTITAQATDQNGKVSSAPTALYPTVSRGQLVVDTQGPRVTDARINPRTGQVTLVMSDALAGLGGGTLQASNFSLMSSTGKVFPVTGLTVSPVSPNTQQTITLSFATSRPLPRGRYVLTVNASGVTDAAGNPLDERYFVPFPGVYNVPGQNFVASFQTDGRAASQAEQFVPPVEIKAARKHRLFVRTHFRRG